MSTCDRPKENKKNGLIVLLIEDRPDILYVHKRWLEKMGLTVDTAMTGEEAFKRFRNYQYALIILDGGLPDMNGLELGKKLREQEKATGRARTPLVLLSGYTKQLIEEWCLELDLEGFEQKPVKFEDLENLVLGCLKKHI